ASFSSDHMPAHFGEIRPRGLTLVISHITSPAHPREKLPRCIKCQSLAEPVLELYWHIGDTATRLARVSPRSVMGEKRTLAIFKSFRGGDEWGGACHITKNQGRAGTFAGVIFAGVTFASITFASGLRSRHAPNSGIGR